MLEKYQFPKIGNKLICDNIALSAYPPIETFPVSTSTERVNDEFSESRKRLCSGGMAFILLPSATVLTAATPTVGSSRLSSIS